MKPVIGFLAMTVLALGAFAQGHQGTKSTATAPSSWANYGNDTQEFDVFLSKAEIHSYKLAGNSYTDINILGAYNRLYRDNFQIGGEGGLVSVPDGTSSKTLLEAMGVLTYNMDRDFTHSFFGNVGLGLAPASDKDKLDYSSKFSFMFNVGKRIPLWNKVSYKPFFRLMKRGDMDMEFYVEALAFSFFF